jgi:hypothetical protein
LETVNLKLMPLSLESLITRLPFELKLKLLLQAIFGELSLHQLPLKIKLLLTQRVTRLGQFFLKLAILGFQINDLAL